MAAEASPLSFAVVAGAAVAAPILAESTRRWKVPTVLFEILLGILIGPQVLGWAHVSPFIDGVAGIGVAALMFLAGYEIDFGKVKGAPIRLGAITWFISLALGLTLGTVLMSTGLAVSNLIVGLALTTTAVGTLLPILQDRGLLDTEFGNYLFAAGSIGEFGPIVAIAVLLTDGNAFARIALLVVFVGVAVASAVLASRPQPPRVQAFIDHHARNSSQIMVRLAMLVIAAMLLLAFELGLDVLLGAFSAGCLFRLAMGRVDSSHHDQTEVRIRAVGFGFLIPVFFVVSGMRFDLDSLLHSHTAQIRVPVFLLCFLVVRGLPVFVMYRKALDRSMRRRLAIVQSTALPLIVVITTIGVESDRMRPENATALVAAGMLSVLLFPIIGLRGLGSSADAPTPSPRETSA